MLDLMLKKLQALFRARCVMTEVCVDVASITYTRTGEYFFIERTLLNDNQNR